MNLVDWYSISLEFVAVLAGVLAAYEVDRWHEGRLQKSNEKEFLTFIREELNENRATLERLLPQLRGEFLLPYFRLRSFAWSSLSERIVLIKNDKVRIGIITAYSKFDMFERTLDRYLELAYTLVKEFGDISIPFSEVMEYLRESPHSKVTEILGKEFPQNEQERQKARWRGLLKTANGIRGALVGQIDQPKDGMIDFCKSLDSQIETEIKRLDC